MASSDLLIEVVLNRGTESAVVWTTDFSYDYVKINGEWKYSHLRADVRMAEDR